ncbi:MAG TPA: tetratricopeptide repeat protein [Chthoniobacterales bacterium]|nr:tetratricopeptide repeat protein [Chthoniobacterales bacterium]
MTSSEALQLLADAKGDDAKITLATVEIAVSSQPAERQDQMREAVYAAAVPHWFDEKTVGALLDVSADKASQIYSIMKRFSFVEPFPRYQACSVHERTRSHVVAFLFREQTEKYVTYSARSLAYFKNGSTPHEQIEAAYHQLIAAPELGASNIAQLYDKWRSRGAWELLQALAAPLDEHLQFHRLQGEALAMTFDVVASARSPYQSLTKTKALLDQAVEIYRKLGDARQEALVLNELGAIQDGRGDLAGAQDSFEASMALASKLVIRDPDRPLFQSDLAYSRRRLGDVQKRRGDLAGAKQSAELAMEIITKLAKTDPASVRWKRELSICYNLLGTIQKAEKDFVGAQKSFESGMDIAKELVEGDPDNVELQRDLSIFHNLLGDTSSMRGKLMDARHSFEVAMAIAKRLVERDPENAEWQRDLMISYNKLGDIKNAEGDIDGAQRSFEAAKAIAEQLTASDADNAVWQRDLAVCYFNLGKICRSTGKWEEARQWAEGDLAITQNLAKRDPSNVELQQDLEASRAVLADVVSKAKGNS